MKNQITITQEFRNEIALNILTDAVIFERTAEAISILQQVANPDGGMWDAECYYNGRMNAIYLLGVPRSITKEDEEKYKQINDVLSDIFENSIKADQSKNMAIDVAKIILEKWEGFLKQTSLDLNTIE